MLYSAQVTKQGRTITSGAIYGRLGRMSVHASATPTHTMASTITNVSADRHESPRPATTEGVKVVDANADADVGACIGSSGGSPLSEIGACGADAVVETARGRTVGANADARDIGLGELDAITNRNSRKSQPTTTRTTL